MSVLELGEGIFEVKAVNGNTQLGGDDYNQCLAELLADCFRDQWHVDLAGDCASQRLLRQLAEEAKIKLSDEVQATVILPPSFAGGRRCSVTVNRDAFEAATADLTEAMEAPALRAMADAGLEAIDLDRVVLVGGMTRMPAVRRLARRITGIEPYAHVDPDQVVALGAAIQAGVLAGQVRSVTLVDVTPLSLGIETQGGLFARVIERNTPVPTRNSRLFTNARDDQTVMEVHVLQGEREMAADNMPLGEFDLLGITPQERGEAKVEVVFDIDANGIIHVSATDLQTETSRRIRVEAAIAVENFLRAADLLVGEAAVQRPSEDISRARAAVETAVSAAREALAAGAAEPIAACGADLEEHLKQLSAAIKNFGRTRRGSGSEDVSKSWKVGTGPAMADGAAAPRARQAERTS